LIKKIIKQKHRYGITLVELIAALGLFSMVMILVFNLNLFGNTVFKKGNIKSTIQSSYRLASNYITKELRYSSNITLLTSMPATPTAGVKYLYVSGGVLKQYDGALVKDIPGVASGIVSTLKFDYQNDSVVSFILSGSLKDSNYQLKSSVYLLNNAGLVPSTGAVIAYQPGQFVTLNINSKASIITPSPGGATSTPIPTSTLTPTPIPGGSTSTPVPATPTPIPYLASLSINSNGSNASLNPIFTSTNYTYSVGVQKDKSVTITSTSNDGSQMGIEIDGVIVKTISNGGSCTFTAAKSKDASNIIKIYVPSSGSNRNIYTITSNSN
jgi:hypothetical protein